MVNTRSSVSRRFTQTGSGGLQIVIVIARVANELPGAFGNNVGDSAEKLLVEGAGYHNSKCSVRRQHAGAFCGFTKLGGENRKIMTSA